jgi:2-keto-4-pentenoate hydratase
MSKPGSANPSVRDGIRRMLEQRSTLLQQGERMIGWKLGFGAPAWLEKFGLTGPLVGFLPESRAHRPGATVSCQGWANPVAEPEIAVHLGRDVDDPDRVEEAISGLSAAIELADVDPPPDDIEEVLAGNIYHRALILSDPGPDGADAQLAGMRARVTKNGSEVADTADLESLTGELVPILGHTAVLLGAAGQGLRAGEVVIMGSVVPPLPLQPGDEITFELAPLPPITVRV